MLLIKRDLFQKLKNHLQKKEISFIVGPRQCGKTTLMWLLIEELKKQDKPWIFLSLDFEKDKVFFESQEKFIKKLNLEFGDTPGFVFIDEIQRKKDAGLFLKGIYDRGLPYKFIVSGSGSVELKAKVHESLAGRKRLFLLPTVTLKEFLNFKTNYKYQNRLKEYLEMETQAYDLLLEYLNFGGYPRVILEDTFSEKLAVISDIYSSYVEKDLSYWLKIEKPEAFTHLIQILSYQTGKLINLTELSNTLGISIPTLKTYLYYAEKTYILKKVTPFFRNVKKELTKTPVYYFYDLGLRNFSAGFFGKIERFSEAGFLFQNLVLLLLKEKFEETGAKIHYWRSKDGAEVDFVIDLKSEVIPVEVKASFLKKPSISRSLRSFIRKYQPKEAWIINLSLKDKVKIGNTLVNILSIWELL
jgi:predicted AAA+ superfamily ATPase